MEREEMGEKAEREKVVDCEAECGSWSTNRR